MVFTLLLSALKADFTSRAVAAILDHEVLSIRMKANTLIDSRMERYKELGSLTASLNSQPNARNYLQTFFYSRKLNPFHLNHQPNAILISFILIVVPQFEISLFFHSHSCSLGEADPSPSVARMGT